MSGTLQLNLTALVSDPAAPASGQSVAVTDSVATVHDYVDQTPRNVSTSGVVGTTFVKLETPVQQVERLVCNVPPGADLILRAGGLVASVLGSVTTPATAGGETLVYAIDGGSQVTATLVAGDNTIALIAKRINYAANATVASVDSVTGGLRISGFLTGGADARALGWSAGSVQLVSGAVLALCGLTAGTTYGVGRDQDVGPGLFSKTFPARALPRLIELSGSAQNAKFILAGKAT